MKTYCSFVPLDAAKPWRLTCPVCGVHTRPVSMDPDQFHRVCRPKAVIAPQVTNPSAAPPGAGSHLMALTALLGITHPPRCDCNRLARWMDRIGPRRCRKHFNHIVEKVRENQQLWGWKDFLHNAATAAWNALWKGLGREFNPLDPIPDMVRLAIDRAEKKEPLPEVPPPAKPVASKVSDTCVYLGEEINKPDPRGIKLRRCYLFGECMLANSLEGVPACDRCTSKLTIGRPDFAKQWKDPLAVYDRRGKQCDALRDILAGRAVFLAGGGPSANALPLESLERRGAWTLCINNMAGHSRFRPQAMVCTDPPEKFSHSVWLDPQIAKFMPTPKLVDPGRGKLRIKLPDGKFAPLMREGKQLATQDCPNVWGVKRREWIACDDTFFLDDGAPNGQYKKGVEKTGEQRTICTLIFAIRILRYLGAREVFLVGVDFHMDPNRGLAENYSFGENRTPEACGSNNAQYLIVNDWLCRLQDANVFARFGMSLYNCNPHSGLRAFPYVPFETAVERVCTGIEAQPNLSQWYEKPPKRK